MNYCPFADFNHLGIPWKGTTTACNQSRRFLEALAQDPAWDTGLYRSTYRLLNNGAVDMHLLHTKKGELIMDVKTSVSLDCRDHEIVGSDLPRGSTIKECKC